MLKVDCVGALWHVAAAGLNGKLPATMPEGQLALKWPWELANICSGSSAQSQSWLGFRPAFPAIRRTWTTTVKNYGNWGLCALETLQQVGWNKCICRVSVGNILSKDARQADHINEKWWKQTKMFVAITTRRRHCSCRAAVALKTWAQNKSKIQNSKPYHFKQNKFAAHPGSWVPRCVLLVPMRSAKNQGIWKAICNWHQKAEPFQILLPAKEAWMKILLHLKNRQVTTSVESG